MNMLSVFRNIFATAIVVSSVYFSLFALDPRFQPSMMPYVQTSALAACVFCGGYIVASWKNKTSILPLFLSTISKMAFGASWGWFLQPYGAGFELSLVIFLGILMIFLSTLARSSH